MFAKKFPCLAVAFVFVVGCKPGAAEDGKKPSADKEGVKWRYEDLSDYLKKQGLKFEEAKPEADKDFGRLRGAFVFENSGRNHRAYIGVEDFETAELAAKKLPSFNSSGVTDKEPTLAMSWGKYVFTYHPSKQTSTEESAKHFEAIKTALGSGVVVSKEKPKLPRPGGGPAPDVTSPKKQKD